MPIQTYVFPKFPHRHLFLKKSYPDICFFLKFPHWHIFLKNSHPDIPVFLLPTLTSVLAKLFVIVTLWTGPLDAKFSKKSQNFVVFREGFISYYTLLCSLRYELQIKRNVFLCARFCHRFVNLQQLGDSSAWAWIVEDLAKLQKYTFCSKYGIFLILFHICHSVEPIAVY